jgi:four helix bundle protein
VGENIIKIKCAILADEVAIICRKLKVTFNECIITDQLARASMSIGANYAEARFAQSRNMFLNRLNISRRECAESQFWLERLYRQKLIEEYQYNKLNEQLVEVFKLLNASCATAKRNSIK